MVSSNSSSKKTVTAFRDCVKRKNSDGELSEKADQILVKRTTLPVQSLSSATSDRICAHQVIADLGAAVKELVENSLDSGATFIEIRVREFGTVGFEIKDDGPGIETIDHPHIALRGATSKLHSFEDISSVVTKSFGFRGEALASLCALSNVTITTCCESDAPLGTKLVFNHDGSIASSSQVHAKRGTIVSVTDFFHSLPVRLFEFRQHASRDFSRCVALIQQYAILAETARILFFHVRSSTSAPRLIFGTRLPIPPKKMIDNYSSIFGPSSAQLLVPVEIPLPEYLCKSGNSGYLIKGFMSVCATGGRPGADRQFLFLHSRPVIIPKITRIINQTYRVKHPNVFPVYFLNLDLGCGSYDANVTPDKLTVFISNETMILHDLSILLKDIFEPKSVFISSKVTDFFKPEKFQSNNESFLNFLNNPTIKKDLENSDIKVKLLQNFEPMRAQKRISSNIEEEFITINNQNILNFSEIPKTQKKKKIFSNHNLPFAKSVLEVDDKDDDDLLNKSDKKEEIIQNDSINNSTLNQVDLDQSQNFEDLKNIEDVENASSKVLPLDTDIPPIEDHIVKHLSKTDFQSMKVLGQFNLGFIIVLLRNEMFIVDQHASDEKFKFEELLRSKPQSQPLLVPVNVSEFLAPEDMETLVSLCSNKEDKVKCAIKRNGFRLDNEFNLISVPSVRGIEFGAKDLVNLVHRIQECGDSCNDSVACDRLRAVHAYKACHSSVRIGKKLEFKTMQRIILNLATLDHPWNCPHGRPTVRFLFDSSSLVLSHQSECQINMRNIMFSGSLADKLRRT